MAQKTDTSQYKNLIIKNAGRLGITPADAADAVITNAYNNALTQLTYLFMQQA